MPADPQHWTITLAFAAQSSMQQTINSTTPSNDSPKTSVSERKLAANRANAQRSSGPRTPQGKARSALNALRHGILAKAAFNVTIEGEARRAEFDELVAGFAQEYQPRTMTEVVAVQQLAGCYWKLAKVWDYEQERAYCEWNCYDGNEESRDCDENNVFQKMEDCDNARADGAFLRKAGLVAPTIPNASANTILRYQGAINMMITRCLALLERRRMVRAKSEEAFEEVDYLGAADAPEKAKSKERPASAATDRASDRANDGVLHKRTQKVAADAQVSPAREPNPASEAPGASADAPPNPRDSA